MQQQSQQWRRSGRSGGGPPPPCLFHLRGFCRFGAACRFSHDVTEQASAALPLHHRQAVHSHAAAGLATAAACDSPGSGQATTSSSATVPWRFRIMSYNVLADCLAHEHAAELYSSAPRFALEWGYRSGLILREILAHRPDVVCLQEVDHFREFKEALEPHGYEGVYTKRTGDRRDGLAMFWRADAVRPVQQRFIQFNQLGLKDNVAQLLAFQRRTGSGGGDVEGSSRTSSEGSASSLSGRKRRSVEEVTPRSRHLRFDSSDDEGASGSGGSSRRRPGSRPSAAAATAALQAVSIEDAVAATEPAAAPYPSVEDATEPVVAAAAGDAAAAPRLPTLVVSNIHVLFNPKRGDLKLGQVRTLMEHVDSLCLQQQKRTGQRAAAVICGDFNSAAGSPIYEFVRSGQLDLSQHDRRRMSGQVEAKGHNWRALQQAFLAQQVQQQQQAPGVFSASTPGAAWQQQQQQQQGDGADAWPGQPPGLNMDAAVASLAGYAGGAWPEPQSPLPQVVPPYALPETDEAVGRSRSSNGRDKSMRAWTSEDARLAAGSGLLASGGGSLIAQHPLQLQSSYGALTGAEAPYSTCHDKFIGCVDYIWFTPSSSSSSCSGDDSWRLRPLGVLQPPPVQTLSCALPSPSWPSDHIALVCDFSLVPAGQEQQPAERRRGKKPAL